jgi:16S rRNA processing protein RimM
VAYNADILLGRILKARGFDGTVTVKLEEAFFEKIPELESVFLEIDGKPVPFFIAESESSGADLLWLKFDGYDSLEKIIGFIGCNIFLTAGEISKSVFKSSRLTGFTVFLPQKILLGTVNDIIENPGQVLLVLESAEGKELLIPLHEDFIISVDKRKKQIVMDLPEGLTEIN